jgi:hypothetical protein
MTTPTCPSYAGYRFRAEIISHAVRLSFRFPLSLRMVDELLAARGVVVSHETMRQWTLKFGQSFELNTSFRQPLVAASSILLRSNSCSTTSPPCSRRSCTRSTRTRTGTCTPGPSSTRPASPSSRARSWSGASAQSSTWRLDFPPGKGEIHRTKLLYGGGVGTEVGSLLVPRAHFIL